MLNCLFAVGKPKEAYFRKAMDEYGKRLQRFGGVKLEFVRSSREEPGSQQAQLLQQEGERLLKLIQPADTVWAMVIEGKPLSSEQWAEQLKAVAGSKRLVLLVGGQLGLSGEAKLRADLSISLGAITMPHEMAAVVALEQLYRAHTINAGMPYHRA